MTKGLLKASAAAALAGTLALTVPAPAEAGHGNDIGAGLLGFGIGAVVGSALTPSTVYVAPPPPPAVDGLGAAPAASGLFRPGGLRPAAMEPRLVQLLPPHPRPVFQPEHGLLPGG